MLPTVITDNAKALIDKLKVPPTPPGLRRSLLLKGDSGTGKTHFALQAPGPIGLIYQDCNRMTLETICQQRDDITELHVDKWDDAESFVTLLKNRQLPYESIIIDTLDMLYTVMLNHIRGSRANLTQEMWGTALNTYRRTTHEMTAAVRPRGDHPGYNVIAVSHLSKVTDKEGNIVDITPAIQGQFKDKLESYYDLVLLADQKVTTKVVSGQEPVSKKQCFVRTISQGLNNCKAPLDWPARFDTYAEFEKCLLAAAVAPKSTSAAAAAKAGPAGT